jgi:hypothetical protein
VLPSIVSPTAVIITEAVSGEAAGLVPLATAGQAGSTSRAADPAIAQVALALYRMRINLACSSRAPGRCVYATGPADETIVP